MSMETKKQPGVILYFDVRPSLKRLNASEKGQLFEASLDYGEHGIEPKLDGMLGIAWDFIMPKLTRDSAHYTEKTQKSRYAVFVRELKKRNLPRITYEEWSAMSDIEREQMVPSEIE